MANDFQDNLGERLFELDANGGLRELPVGPPSLMRKAQTLIDAIPGLSYSYLFSLAQASVQTIVRPAVPTDIGPSEDLPSDELTFALVRTSVEKALATGADAIGLLVGLTGRRHAKMMKIFEEHGLSWLDGPDKKDAPDMFFKMDGHWNAAGHCRAAELILPEILRCPSSGSAKLTKNIICRG
jgi:hypothetical protein